MSEVLQALRDSADPLENDLAQVYDHWQDVKRSKGARASLGYEPRDINTHGAVTVISGRVLNASAGFEEVDSKQSYEAIVLKYPERFTSDVIAAAQQRLKLGASKAHSFRQQDIQYFIKASSLELFDERGVQPSVKSWIGRTVQVPSLHKENIYVEEFLATGFRSFVWLHEQEKEGERGRGLTAVVHFGPKQSDQKVQILDAVFFERPVGKELLRAQKGNEGFISQIDASRHSRTWPVSEVDVETIFSAVREKIHKIAEYENQNPDPNAAQSLETTEDITALRQVVLRRYQNAFRKALLAQRPNQCAITGTSEVSVLEAAHIIPYAAKYANRDKPENGLLLRGDIHKLFDAHLISINPSTKEVEVANIISSPDYLSIRGKVIEDAVSTVSLTYHFGIFQEIQK
ncbi:hypothetical protein GGR95_003751 [Sulfitobacter undariae]|uniref:HNH nuclease domain-containing protein n=1 Tax=Sulfitobacter undariae TaxID=1563671 RepID=A0A7W6E7E9_9RHOB|nr:HNH endonuclease [Sulfitobacter undariae]MBB3996083.1 hypothetical protein [Sulfitobacter undariae]